MTENRLLLLAGLFLFTCTLALTVAPAVRVDSFAALTLEDMAPPWIVFTIWTAGVLLARRGLQRWLARRDVFLFPAAMLLCGWGLLLITRLYPAYGLRQSIWFAAAAGLLGWGASWRGLLDFLRARKTLWLCACLLLTALTFLLGVNPSGSGPNLWLGLGDVYFQPSEPLKLFLVVYLAAYLADRGAPGGEKSVHVVPLLLPTLWLTGLTAGLLLVQRDLGTLTIVLMLYAAILYFGTGRKRIFFLTILFMIAAFLGGMRLFPLVQARVEGWLDPWHDPSGRSYQIVQSLMAVANGGLIGRGLGLGHPRLVPVAHSDFIFAALCEEFGLLGAVAALCLIALIVQRGLRAALRAGDAFSSLLAAGVAVWLGIQSIVIVGGNLRLLPLTGLTLPFVSYGGTSLVTSVFGLLILLRISTRSDAGGTGRVLLPCRRAASAFTLLAAGFAALGALAAWWGVGQAPLLLERSDNLRRSLAELYVPRGALLDRSGAPLNRTDTDAGKGAYRRAYDYPALAPVLGYTHPVYGLAGLEAVLDPYLRGESGAGEIRQQTARLFTGYPPPGADLRLTLDLNIQREADRRMSGTRGALVLIDAASGNVLALASHPAYEPLRLADDWPSLVHAPDFPLLNRPLLGRYAFPAAADGERVSPLQMATFAAGGIGAPPHLVAAIHPAGDSWRAFPASVDPLAGIRAPALDAGFRLSAGEWLGSAGEGEARLTWYLASSSAPALGLALVLESDDPALAREIGQGVLARAGARR